MGKSRACGFDIFALNDIIDTEKLAVLYQASLTECAPNDPFNDWSKVIDSIINIYLDIIDRISSEQTDLEISDELSDYDGNYIIDDWENFRIYSDVVNDNTNFEIIDSDDYIFEDYILNDEWENVSINSDVVISEEEFELIDSDDYIFEDFVLTDNWEIVTFISDVIDAISSDVEFIDSEDYIFEDFVLTDNWENELVYSDFNDSENDDVEFIDEVGDNVLNDYFEDVYVDVIDSETPSVDFVIANEDFWEFNIIDGEVVSFYNFDVEDGEGINIIDGLNEEYDVLLFD